MKGENKAGWKLQILEKGGDGERESHLHALLLCQILPKSSQHAVTKQVIPYGSDGVHLIYNHLYQYLHQGKQASQIGANQIST